MTSPSSSLTPLGFTREYQSYRAVNAGVPFPDSRLLAAVRFWARFPDALSSESYSSFWLEDLPPLLTADRAVFEDLHPDELAEIAAFLATLDQTKFPSALTSQSLWEVAARKWLYVGDAARTLDALGKAGIAASISESDLSAITADGQLLPKAILDRLGNANDSLRSWLSRVDAEWQSLHETGHANQATCVLVERDSAGRPIRGRLRTLEAHVEALPKGRETDEVVFGHQLCTADDPQVRGAFAALVALRNADFGLRNGGAKPGSPDIPHSAQTVMARSGATKPSASRPISLSTSPETSNTSLDSARDRPQSVQNVMARSEATKPSAFQPEHPVLSLGTNKTPHSAIRNPHSFLRARFTFANGGNREPYGGDSLGFACLVTAFGDLWSKNLHRERRLVSAQVALTGALDAEGGAEAASGSTLPLKVERVFFSPLSFIVIPQANRQAAEAEVARLHSLYPNRRLRILTAERATDLITDGNITIPERVCLGEYAVRAAAKYTRSTRVQVPLLAVLSYLLLCLVYPKAWVGFDWNPAIAEFVGTTLVVRNATGNELWRHKANPEVEQASATAVLANLDGDSTLEVACMVMPKQRAAAMHPGELIVFDDDGAEMFRESPAIFGEYPGDTATNLEYDFGNLKVIDLDTRKLVLTVVNKSIPARMHLKLWQPDGALAGWYINAGYASGEGSTYIDAKKSRLFGSGLNNRVSSACLFVISLDSIAGASPPYVDSYHDLSWVKPGIQLQYIVFPPTDLCKARGARQNYSHALINEGDLVRVDVDEMGEGRNHRLDSLACVSYYIDSSLHVVTAICDDSFISMRERFVAQGTLPAIDWREYHDSLLSRVRYWVDTGWVAGFLTQQTK